MDPNKLIIEWKTLKLGEKLYEENFINELKRLEKVYILSTGNIFEYIKIKIFISKFSLNAECFYMNFLFKKNDKEEKKWITFNIKKIVDDTLDKNFIYCDVYHFIMDDLYEFIPMYTNYIWNCKLSGLCKFLIR